MSFLKKLVGFLTVIIMILSLAACGGSKEKEIINYADAESFEAALNEGKNLEGTIVQFVALELKPNSAYGYNIWAGEHLNFISSRNPDVEAGDTVIVRATTIESNLGSWLIYYEKVDDAVIDDSTISFNGVDTANTNNELSEKTESDDREDVNSSPSSSGTTSFAINNSNSSEQPLELVDFGWYISSSSGDTAYVNFCGIIYNPNEKLIAEFPKVIVTAKNDGSILATDEQVGSIVMPEDTITLCGMFTMPISDLEDDAEIVFSVDWSDFGSGTSFYSAARTTDFTIDNVSERKSGSESFITGELTNNYTEDIDMVNLSIVLRKDGEIVYMENTFLDGLKVGIPKAFQFHTYNELPEHDMIDISVMVW